MTTKWIAIGAFWAAVGVGLGAFGAHGLKSRFDAYAMGIWEKAVFYHFLHAAGMLVVPLFARTGVMKESETNAVCWLLLAGVVLFSGSLYALALSGVTILGAVTPFGGTAFIAAWVLLAYRIAR